MLGLCCGAAALDRMTTLRVLGAVDTPFVRASVPAAPLSFLSPPSRSTPRTSTPPPPPSRSALETATPTHIGPVTNAPHAIAVPIALRTNEQFMLGLPRSTATPPLVVTEYPLLGAHTLRLEPCSKQETGR